MDRAFSLHATYPDSISGIIYHYLSCPGMIPEFRTQTQHTLRKAGFGTITKINK